MASDYSLSDAFKAIEDDLIASMMRNMDHHRAEEDDQGINWTMWQSEQLKSLEQYKQSLEGYKEKFADINSQIDKLIRTANKTGSMEQEVEILEAIKQGFTATKVSSGLSAKFFALNDCKLEALIKATVSDMEKAEYAILRKSEDAYRKVIYNAQVYANTGAGTYEKAVDMATKDMLSAGLTCVQYKNGAVHTLADYADMAIRTASKRAYLQGEGAMRQEWGIHTVIVNKRINPCPHCLPFCGKVFIDDVWSGGTKKDGDYPLLSTAIAAGLYHPRCKDAHSTYFPGISSEPEKTYSKKELKTIERNEARETRQQYAQRQADKYGRLSKYSLDEENRQKYAAASERYEEAASSLDTGTSTTQGTLEELFDGSLETMERQLEEVSEELEEIKSIDLDEYEKSLESDKKYLRTMGEDDTMKSYQFHSQADPMVEVTGAGEDSNPEEIKAFRKELKELGVELIERDDKEDLVYSPAPTPRRPGQVHISKGASYSAWCHEIQHVRDDYAAGWSGLQIISDADECYEREKRAYAIEIRLAREAGREDIVEKLLANLEKEREYIYGEKQRYEVD